MFNCGVHPQQLLSLHLRDFTRPPHASQTIANDCSVSVSCTERSKLVPLFSHKPLVFMHGITNSFNVRLLLGVNPLCSLHHLNGQFGKRKLQRLESINNSNCVEQTLHFTCFALHLMPSQQTDKLLLSNSKRFQLVPMAMLEHHFVPQLVVTKATCALARVEASSSRALVETKATCACNFSSEIENLSPLLADTMVLLGSTFVSGLHEDVRKSWYSWKGTGQVHLPSSLKKPVLLFQVGSSSLDQSTKYWSPSLEWSRILLLYHIQQGEYQ